MNTMPNVVRGIARGSGTIACLAVLACAPTARGQNYKTMEVQVQDAELRTLRTTARDAWNNAAAFGDAEQQKAFDRFYTGWFFPSMTQTSAAALAELGSRRDQLLRSTLQRPNHEQGFVHLTKLTFDTMKQIAVEDYHPAVRYNAMLIIGALDQKSGEPPVPLPEAADFLLQQLQSGASPDAVKLGALIGLDRHAQSGLPDDKRIAITDELVKLVTSERPGDRTVEGHAWLQFKAAQTLASMGELGENNRVHDALVTLINNDDVPVVERAFVAKSLANEQLKAKYTPQAGINADATVAALGNILADVIEAEEQEAFKYNEEQRMGGFSASTIPLGPGEEPIIGFSRGRLLQRINYVLDGFAAVMGALPDELKKEVEAVLAPVREIQTLALDRNTVVVALTKKIEESADLIVESANGLGQEAAAADTDKPVGTGGLGDAFNQ
jgi:hypothetical protein